MDVVKKVRGNKSDFIKKEWLNETDYINHYYFKRTNYFRLESDQTKYFSIKMKKTEKVENNRVINEDFNYKIQLDKNLIILNKDSIQNNYFLNILVRNSIGDFNYMKNYISKLSSNSFFEKEIFDWLNNSSSNFE